MTDETMTSGEHEEHVHPPYMKVFSILAALTLIELFIPPTIGDVTWLSVSLLILIAVWKMKLIMGCFMHLAYDARILLIVAVTPAVLASIMVIAFMMEY